MNNEYSVTLAVILFVGNRNTLVISDIEEVKYIYEQLICENYYE